MKKLSLRYLKKSIKDSFKPYKHKNQIWNDFLQPLKGVGSLSLGMLGFLYLILSPMMLPLVFFSSILTDIWQEGVKQSCKNASFYILEMLKESFSWVLFVPVAIMQIVTSPLLLAIIPLRMILTKMYGSPSIIENKGLLRELKNFEVATVENDKEVIKQKIFDKLVTYYRNSQKDSEKFVQRASLNQSFLTPLGFDTYTLVYKKYGTMDKLIELRDKDTKINNH